MRPNPNQTFTIFAQAATSTMMWTFFKRLSILERLMTTIGLVSLLILSLSAILLISNFRSSVLHNADERLRTVSDALIAQVEPDALGQLNLSQLPADTRYEKSFGGLYWQISEIKPDQTLRPVLRSRSLADEFLTWPKSNQLAFNQEKVVHRKGPDDQDLRLLGRAFLLPDHDKALAVLTAEDQRPIFVQIRRFSQQTFIGVAIMLVTLIMALLLQIRLGFAPLKSMSEELAQIRSGQKGHLDGDYPSELDELKRVMNGFIAHNSQVVERAKTQVGNLAHALKTPLTVIATQAQSKDQIDHKTLLQQTETMSGQIDHYLKRASVAARTQTIGACCDVNETVNDLVRSLEKIYHNVDIDSDVETGLKFKGEKEDLSELVGNLLENACKWSRGLVSISIATDEDGMFKCEILDNGVGLKAEEIEKIMARGARLDEKIPGTGLGLSIVADIAQLHGGHLKLSPSQVRNFNGLFAQLWLPKATHEA